MNARLLWKEYREHRAAAVVLAIAGTLSLVGLAVWERKDNFRSSGYTNSLYPDTIAWCAVLWVWACGLVNGSLALGGERENRTLSFLDALPLTRREIWRTKAIMVLILLGIQLVWLFTLAGALGGFDNWGQLAVSLGLAVLLGLNALAWSFLTGTWAHHVLGTLGWSFLLGNLVALLVLQLLALLVAFILYLAALLVYLSDLVHSIAVQQVSMVVLLLVGPSAAMAGAMWLSARRFCSVERMRSGSLTRKENSPLGALSWLMWRQGRVTFFVLFGLGLVPNLIALRYGLLSWPPAAFLLGLIAGISAFSEEEASGGRDFLAHLRVSPSLLWIVRTGSRLLVLTLGLLFLGIALAWLAPQPIGPLQELDHFLAGRGAGVFLLAMVFFPLCGFSLGQLCSLLIRSTLVAFVLAALLGVALLFVWLPSMFLGGMPFWQPLLLLAIILAGGCWLSWAWMCGQMAVRKNLLRLLVIALLVLAWTAGMVAYRVLEYPPVKPSFDLAAFEASLPTPEQNAGGLLIRQAALQFQEVHKQSFHEVPSDLKRPNKAPEGPAGAVAPLPGPGGIFPPPEYTQEEQLGLVIKEGWTKAGSKGLATTLDELFQKKWLHTLQAAQKEPLGMIEDPRNYEWNSDKTDLIRSFEAWSLVLPARALQLQAQGQSEDSLEMFRLALMVSRQLRHKAVRMNFQGLSMQREALKGLDAWLSSPGVTVAQLRQALDLVTRHEAELQPLSDALRDMDAADYLANRTSGMGQLAYMGPVKEEFARFLLEPCLDIPWERARMQRWLNWVFSQRMRLQEEVLANRGVINDRWMKEMERQAEEWLHLRGTSLWFFDNMGPNLVRFTLVGVWWNEVQLASVRAMRLKIALGLYQREHRHPAERLEDLVPAYLPALPEDPFSGKSFGYRLCKGKQMEKCPEGVQPGQAILWSVGPDGVDNGGIMAREPDYYNPGYWLNQDVDLVFIVPKW